MRKFYFLVAGLFVFSGIQAQIVNIPDANFKAKLLAASPSNWTAKDLAGNYFKIDSNNDGEIQVSEAQQVVYLDVGTSNIASIEGILNFNNLITLWCGNNKLTNLNVKTLVNLRDLSCSSNRIITLDYSMLPLSLVRLACSFNQLVKLDVASLVNLDGLNCGSNMIDLLDVKNLVNLKSLSCEANKITSLDVSQLVNLSILDCSSNMIKFLDVSSLVNLTDLSCNRNLLTSLDLMNLKNLKSLMCGQNQFTSLNLSNLKNLQYFYCGFNKLTKLYLNNLVNLKGLDCDHNQLNELDLSDLTNLESLNCSVNQLTTLYLDNLVNLLVLFCKDNNITYLFIKNTKIITSQSYFSDINFSESVQYICANDKQLEGVQSYINKFGYMNTHVNTYCNFFPGGKFYSIVGNIKLDSNTDGCDDLDINFPNFKFSIANGTVKGNFITDLGGKYNIPVLTGNHTIIPVFENPTYFKASPVSKIVSFPTQTSPFTQDFCITPNGIHPDLEVTVLPINRARPGFDASYKISYKNKGTNTQSGSVNLTFDDAVLDFVTANPVVNNQNTNTISWNFTDLKPFETREIEVTLNVNSPMETPAVNNNDILSYTATITSVQTDETPTDNTFTLNQTVVNSFDPNDKTCLEGSTIAPSAVGKYVHYMIRFENKGTAEAQNVVVKDMIDTDKFDISSLVVTQGSHPFVTKITETNKVEFIFENINLPFDDATNDGYVAFKIKTNPSLVVGDSFSNTASIYFDYNFPIVTNTATTSVLQSLGTNDFEFDSYFKIYPNPAKNNLNLDVKKQIKVSSISIYNTLGQQIFVIPNAQYTKQVDISNLKTGNYFIKLASDKGSAIGKFIKS